MGQRRLHHLFFHSLQRGAKRENKTLKITVSLLKNERLSCRPPCIPRSLPSLLPPPAPPRGAHVCFLQHRATWFQLGAEPHQDGEEIHICGTLRTEPPPAREAVGLQHRDEGLDRGIAAHAVRGGAGGGRGVGRPGRGGPEGPAAPAARPRARGGYLPALLQLAAVFERVVGAHGGGAGERPGGVVRGERGGGGKAAAAVGRGADPERVGRGRRGDSPALTHVTCAF